jgi:hypothetical protein
MKASPTPSTAAQITTSTSSTINPEQRLGAAGDGELTVHRET